MESSNSVTNAALEKMRALDTDTLVRIWREGDQSEYAVVEQEAARKVLVERLGGVAAAPASGAVIVDDNTATDEDEGTITSDRWASFLSGLAAFISWLLLVLFVGLAGFTAWQTIQQGQMMGARIDQLLLQLLSPLNYLLMGLFYFVVLQFVSKGLAMLDDIRDYAEYLVARKG